MTQQNGNIKDHAGITAPHIDETTTGATTGLLGKGKGKAIDPVKDVDMRDGDDDEEDEEDDEDYEGEDDEAGDDEDGDDLDNLNEIEEENIIGSRTRGKNIDFAKAAEEADDLDDDDDEEDDEDYEDADEEMEH